MAKHVAHMIRYPKFISGQQLPVAKQPKNVSKTSARSLKCVAMATSAFSLPQGMLHFITRFAGNMFCKYHINIAEIFKQAVHCSEKIAISFAKKTMTLGVEVRNIL